MYTRICEYKKWRGHSYALYLRGGPRKLEPLSTNKNAATPRRGA